MKETTSFFKFCMVLTLSVLPDYPSAAILITSYTAYSIFSQPQLNTVIVGFTLFTGHVDP
jgi:hypothetical protein